MGHSPNPAAEAALKVEDAAHGGFLRLDVEENYKTLTVKTLAFLTAVLEQYTPQYIIKVDDDVYLRLDRVPSAISQWAARGADYIGCMKTGRVFTSATLRWYEPHHDLLGTSTYF